MKVGDLVQVMFKCGPHAGRVGVITSIFKHHDREKNDPYNDAYNTAIYIQDEHGFEYAFYPRSLRVIA